MGNWGNDFAILALLAHIKKSPRAIGKTADAAGRWVGLALLALPGFRKTVSGALKYFAISEMTYLAT